MAQALDTPTTLETVDAALLATHERYIRAMMRDSLSEAADLWVRLNELLDLRNTIPQQRRP